MESYGRCLRANMCSLASSTPVAALDRSYTRTTNLSNVFRSVYVTSIGNWLMLLKVSVTSSNTSHVCHADFFPSPLKAETTSHSVKAYEYTCPQRSFGIELLVDWDPLHANTMAKGSPQSLNANLLQLW